MLKWCNFIMPQALIQQLYYYYLILLLNHRSIFDRTTKRSEAHVLKGCIKNCSIVKLYYKVKIINNISTRDCYRSIQWIFLNVAFSPWGKHCGFPKLHFFRILHGIFGIFFSKIQWILMFRNWLDSHLNWSSSTVHPKDLISFSMD